MSKIVNTALSLASVQGVTWLTTLSMTLTVPRFVGAADFGIMSVCGALMGLITLVAAFGTTNYVAKQVARRPEAAADIVANALALRGALWVLMALVSLVAASTIVDARVVLIVALSLAWTGIQILSGTMSAGLLGNQTLGRYAMVGASGAAVGTAVGALCAYLGGGAIGWITGNLVVAAITSIFLARVFWRHCGGPTRIAIGSLTGALREGSAYLLFESAIFAVSSTSVFVLAWFTGAEEVARFTLAVRVAGIPLFVPVIVVAALYPALSTSAINDLAWFSKAILTGMRILFLTLLPCVAGIVLLGPAMLDIIAGEQFKDAFWPLVLTSLALPLIGVDMILGTALFALDRQRQWTTVVCVAAPASIALNFLAIPLTDAVWDRPAVGPAAVAVILELFLAVAAARLLWSLVAFPQLVRPLGVTLLAVGVMSVVALLSMRELGLAFAIPASGLAYVAAAYLLRAIDPEDMRWLRTALSRRVARDPGVVAPVLAPVPGE